MPGKNTNSEYQMLLESLRALIQLISDNLPKKAKPWFGLALRLCAYLLRRLVAQLGERG